MPLTILAQYLAGEFQNSQQAIANPAWYVHLKLWHRPLPKQVFAPGIAFFCEQANVYKLEQAYRQRIVVIYEQNNQLWAQYYKFHQPDAWCRASQSRLSEITLQDVEILPTCLLPIEVETQSDQSLEFNARTDNLCYFTYGDATYHVKLGFAARKHQFLSYDQGIDTKTGQVIWGAMLGPFEFTKVIDLSEEIRPA